MKKLILALALAVSTTAFANPDAVKKGLAERFPEVKPDRIVKAPVGNLWEVQAGTDVFYTDEKVTYLVLGALVDAKTRRNYTEDSIKKLTAIKWSDLPLDLAVKTVRGNGERKLAVFEDPNCGYCKKFMQEIKGVDNVTIYHFLYPILSPDSLEKTKAVWCSPDKSKAWLEWMVDSKAPAAGNVCDTSAIDKTLAFGQKFRVTGTPAIILEDGERIPGAIPPKVLEDKWAALAKKN